MVHQVIYVSATPGEYELSASEGVVVEQIIRPTGLLDPTISILPIHHQMDHLLEALHERLKRQEQALVITLTKRMAEELTKYMTERGIRCQYIHAEVETLDRVRILQELVDQKFDVLVGVNLLREGLDLPSVSLVAILEADKEGFLRNKRSLLQMIGRAARHVRGEVYMYADKVTPSMDQAITETKRRRALQATYNQKHGITPKPVKKAVNTLVAREHPDVNRAYALDEGEAMIAGEPTSTYQSIPAIEGLIKATRKKMEQASRKMDYIRAQQYKDALLVLEGKLSQLKR